MVVRDEDVYPVETVVRLRDTGEFGIIKRQVFVMDGRNFLHYEGPIEGRGDGYWCIRHERVDLECLPLGYALKDGRVVRVS